MISPKGFAYLIRSGLFTEAPFEGECRCYKPLRGIDILRYAHFATYAEVEVWCDTWDLIEVAPHLRLRHELEVCAPTDAGILLMPPAEEARGGDKAIARSELPYSAELIVVWLGNPTYILVEWGEAEHRATLGAEVGVGHPRHEGIIERDRT